MIAVIFIILFSLVFVAYKIGDATDNLLGGFSSLMIRCVYGLRWGLLTVLSPLPREWFTPTVIFLSVGIPFFYLSYRWSVGFGYGSLIGLCVLALTMALTWLINEALDRFLFNGGNCLRCGKRMCGHSYEVRCPDGHRTALSGHIDDLDSSQWKVGSTTLSTSTPPIRRTRSYVPQKEKKKRIIQTDHPNRGPWVDDHQFSDLSARVKVSLERMGSRRYC